MRKDAANSAIVANCRTRLPALLAHHDNEADPIRKGRKDRGDPEARARAKGNQIKTEDVLSPKETRTATTSNNVATNPNHQEKVPIDQVMVEEREETVEKVGAANVDQYRIQSCTGHV